MQSKFYRFPAATSDDDVIPAATMSDCDNEDDVFIDIEGDKDVDDTDDVIKNRQTVDHHDSHHGAIFSLALFASTALPSDSSPICMTLLKHMQRPWTPDPASPVSTSGSASPINSISDASFSSNCSTMMSGLLKPRNIAPQNSTYSQQLLPDVVQLPVGRRSPVKRTGFLIDEILSPAFGVRHSAAAQTTSPSKTSMQFDDRIGNETKLCSALKSVFESVPSCRDRYDPDRKVKSTSPSLCARPSSITAQTRCNSIAANNSQKARSPAKAISAAAVSRPIDTKIGIKHVPVKTKTEISSGSTSPTHAPALGSTSRSTQAVGAQFPLPAWVYCTRYSDRPSSGPRSRKSNKRQRTDGSLTSAALTSTGGANGCGQSPSSSSSSVTSSSTPDDKRPRTAFNSEQLAILRREFDDNRYLTEDRRRRLADALNLHESQIKIWFQNKRAKLKKASGAPNPLALELAAQGLYNHSTTTTTSSKSSSGKSPLECSS